MGYEYFKRKVSTPGVKFAGDVMIVTGAGAPTDGASGTEAGRAAPGSVYIDRTNAVLYVNGGTKAVPAWVPGTTGGGGSALEIRNETGGALAANDLLYVTGWNETQKKFLVSKADADVAGGAAMLVLRAALADATNGVAFLAFRSAATLDTQSGTSAVGDPVYLSTTAGGWTPTAPTGATAIVQVVGRVAVRSLTVGVVEFDLRDFPTVGTNDLQNLAVTEPKLGDSAVTGRKVTNDALGVNAVTAVAVDHAAASPVELLALDAANDRIARVTLVATEAAAGAPDIDVGTANAVQSVVANFGAGAFPLGYRLSRVIRVPAGDNVRATINGAGTAGAFNAFVEALTPLAQTANIRDLAVTTGKLAAGAVTGPKITDAAFGLQGVTPVVVDHADASPKEILAADASNDRVALVYVVATEAAAGEPDVDIGTTNTINSVVDDFKAGAWVVDERVFNLIRIPAGENVRATIAVAGTAGAFNVYVHVLTPALKRAQLAEDALGVYGIPAHDLKGADGAALVAAETAGTFNVAVAANVISVQGEITDNETEVSVGYFQFVLPPEYVAGGDVQLRIKTALIKTGAAVDNGSTIDAEAYEQTGNGAVGADICATAAQSWAAVDTWYTKTFTITATDLVAGDIVNFKITTSVIDSEAGAGTLRANLDGIAVLLDVKG